MDTNVKDVKDNGKVQEPEQYVFPAPVLENLFKFLFSLPYGTSHEMVNYLKANVKAVLPEPQPVPTEPVKEENKEKSS